MLKILLILLFIAPICVLAEDFDDKQELEQLIARLAESDAADASAFFNMWVNPLLEEELSRTQLDDNGITSIYRQFKDLITTPPDPHNLEREESEYGEDRWVRIYQLGMLINSMLFYLPDDKIEKYGELLWAMRDTLYIDLQYVAWGIRGNFSKDEYFYTLHSKSLQRVEDSYSMVIQGGQK